MNCSIFKAAAQFSNCDFSPMHARRYPLSDTPTVRTCTYCNPFHAICKHRTPKSLSHTPRPRVPCPRVPASPRPRVPASPRPRVPRPEARHGPPRAACGPLGLPEERFSRQIHAMPSSGSRGGQLKSTYRLDGSHRGGQSGRSCRKRPDDCPTTSQ